MKRPAFQFYPADWRKDVELQSCSMAAQGMWINMMCVAHECEPYGHLTVNGKGMTAAQIGRQVGLSAKEAQSLIDELIDAGVARKTAEGVIYSKRMVDDEDLRNRRAEGGKAGSDHGIKGAEHGSKGGRPRSGKGGSKTPLEGDSKPPPSSSSSSSSSPSGYLERAATAEVVARDPQDPEPEDRPPPTPAGAACLAMRRAGLQQANPSDPRLVALLEQGATSEELAAVAAEAAAKGKGWAWVLHVVQARREEAAAVALVQPVEANRRHDPERANAAPDAEATALRAAEQEEHRKAARSPEAQAARIAAMAALAVRRTA